MNPTDLSRAEGVQIPSQDRRQPRLVEGDLPEVLDQIQVDEAIREAQIKQFHTLADGTHPGAVFNTLPAEPSDDPLAAAHGAAKFRVRFCDAEVLAALDDLAKSEGWFISLHSIKTVTTEKGWERRITHWFKSSERFPTLDIPRCADALEDDARRRLNDMRDLAVKGLEKLDMGPKLMEDEKD